MSHSVRVASIRRFRDVLSDAIPSLEGRVGVGQQPQNNVKRYPCLNLFPVKWKYLPDQASEALDPVDDRVVENVGRFETILQMRLSVATLNQRQEIEQDILDFFLMQEDRPGILVTTVSTIPELGDFVTSWELETDEWRDEKAFDNQSDTIIELTGTIPALVSRGGVYRMDEVLLGITHDFETSFTEATFNSSAAIEPRVQVNEDGTITTV